MIRRENCPLCGTASPVIFQWPFAADELKHIGESAPTLRASLSKLNLEIRFCGACDFHFQSWVPECEELGYLYATPFGEAQILQEISRQRLHWFAHMTEEILVMRQMVHAPFPKVLDYGCNWGKWASMALAHGCDVYGVEVNPVAAEFCAKRGIKILTGKQIAQLQFEFINVDQVMEHLSNPLEVASELARCLAAGGYMKWSTPQDARLPRKLREARASANGSIVNKCDLDALEPLVHVNLFTNRSLRVLGARVGLRAVRLPFLKWMGAGQLWNMPRQFNRNIVVPKKRWLMQGTYLWFTRSQGL